MKLIYVSEDRSLCVLSFGINKCSLGVSISTFLAAKKLGISKSFICAVAINARKFVLEIRGKL